jgi:hypothetical protein
VAGISQNPPLIQGANRTAWVALLLLLGVALAVLGHQSPVDATRRDARSTLLVSQALVETRSIRLDRYLPLGEADGNYRYFVQRGHIYDFFPLGTSFYLAPLIGVARLAGQDMAVVATESAWQRFLAAASVCLSFWAAFALARRRVGRGASLVLALAVAAGSSYASTAPAALRSLDLGFLAILLAALAVTAGGTGPLPRWAVPAAAVALFAAYFCRPTFAWPGALLTLYAISRNRGRGLSIAALVALQAGVLVLFSYHEFGRPLPPYYLPTRIGGSHRFWTALWGQLFSPSRGALVFNPFVAVILAGALLSWRRLRRDPLAWVGLLWLGGHVLITAQFAHWWGGYSYGSRLFADALPGFLLLGAAVWQALNERPAGAAIGLGRVLMPAALMLGIWLNFRTGLFNLDSSRWNSLPDVNDYPRTIFDWRFPQFLASPRQLAAKQEAYLVPELEPLSPGQRIEPDDARHVLAPQWYPIEETPAGRWRWSRGHRVRLWFRLPPAVRDSPGWALRLALGARGRQRVLPRLDGAPLPEVAVTGFEPKELQWTLPASDPAGAGEAAGQGIRCLELDLPDAVRPADGHRTIAVVLFWLRLDPPDGNPTSPPPASSSQTPGDGRARE